MILLFDVFDKIYLFILGEGGIFFVVWLLGVESVPSVHSRPWPDCPDSGTPTAPLCRLILRRLKLGYKGVEMVLNSQRHLGISLPKVGSHLVLGREGDREHTPWATTKGPLFL